MSGREMCVRSRHHCKSVIEKKKKKNPVKAAQSEMIEGLESCIVLFCLEFVNLDCTE